MAKWKRRLAAIEQAEREEAQRAREARLNDARRAAWDAETAVLAARYGSDVSHAAWDADITNRERAALEKLAELLERARDDG